MANFKKKNNSHRARIKKLDPCDKWTTPKYIQRVKKESKSTQGF